MPTANRKKMVDLTPKDGSAADDPTFSGSRDITSAYLADARETGNILAIDLDILFRNYLSFLRTAFPIP